MNVQNLPNLLLRGKDTGLSISLNEHKLVYESAEEWAAHETTDWVSDEEKKLAIKTDTIWELRWYPDTPVGFCTVSASSLEALLAYIEEQDEI